MRHIFLVLLLTFSTAAGSAESHGIHEAEQWAFASSVSEGLRFEVGKRWYDEVPRTNFYGQAHKRMVKAGLIDQKFVEGWLARNNKSESKRY
jgi:hypothetical protein